VVSAVPALQSVASIQELLWSATTPGVLRQPVPHRNDQPSQVCHCAASDPSEGGAFQGRMSQRGAVAAPTHWVLWLPRIGRTLSAVANRRAVTVRGRRGRSSRRGGRTV